MKFYFLEVWTPNVYFSKVKFMAFFIICWSKLGMKTFPIPFLKRILINLIFIKKILKFLILGVVGPKKLILWNLFSVRIQVKLVVEKRLISLWNRTLIIFIAWENFPKNIFYKLFLGIFGFFLVHTPQNIN